MKEYEGISGNIYQMKPDYCTVYALLISLWPILLPVAWRKGEVVAIERIDTAKQFTFDQNVMIQ